MVIEKRRIVELLISRGEPLRAEWADRQLPDPVDTDDHAGILATLRLNLADLTDPAKP